MDGVLSTFYGISVNTSGLKLNNAFIKCTISHALSYNSELNIAGISNVNSYDFINNVKI